MNPPAAEEVRPYDFTRPPRIPGDRMRAIQNIHGLLATTLASWLTTRLREPVEVEVEEVDQESAAALVATFPSPCNAYLLTLTARGGAPALVELPPDLAFMLAERSMGGTGPVLVLDRPLTPLERMVVRMAVDRLVSRLDELWEPHLPLGLAVTGFESDPGMVRLGGGGGRVLSIRLRVRTAEMESRMRVALTWDALEPFMVRRPERPAPVVAPQSEERLRELRALHGSLRGARVLLQARVPAFPVSVERLGRLQPGEVLLSGVSPRGPLDVLLAGQHRFSAIPGRAGPALAVELTHAVAPESERSLRRYRP